MFTAIAFDISAFLENIANHFLYRAVHILPSQLKMLLQTHQRGFWTKGKHPEEKFLVKENILRRNFW